MQWIVDGLHLELWANIYSTSVHVHIRQPAQLAVIYCQLLESTDCFVSCCPAVDQCNSSARSCTGVYKGLQLKNHFISALACLWWALQATKVSGNLLVARAACTSSTMIISVVSSVSFHPLYAYATYVSSLRTSNKTEGINFNCMCVTICMSSKNWSCRQVVMIACSYPSMYMYNII